MRTRSCLSCVLCGLLLLASPAAYAQVKLEQKIPSEAEWKVKMQVVTKQTLNLAGQDIVTAGKQEMVLKKSSEAPGNDGKISVRQEMESLKASLTLPGSVELEYDSTKPDAPPQGTQFDQLIDIFKVMAGAKWTLVYGPDGRVVDVKGQDDILKSLDENLRPLLERQFDPEYLKNQANDELKRLPNQAVKQGDTWTREFTMRLEGGQNMMFTTQYQYLGTIQRDGRTLDKVASKPLSVDYSIDQDAPTPLRVTNSELKIEEAEGMYLFDREQGSFVETSEKTRITGVIDFVVQGQEIKGNLDLTMSIASQHL